MSVNSVSVSGPSGSPIGVVWQPALCPSCQRPMPCRSRFQRQNAKHYMPCPRHAGILRSIDDRNGKRVWLYYPGKIDDFEIVHLEFGPDRFAGSSALKLLEAFVNAERSVSTFRT